MVYLFAFPETFVRYEEILQPVPEEFADKTYRFVDPVFEWYGGIYAANRPSGVWISGKELTEREYIAYRRQHRAYKEPNDITKGTLFKMVKNVVGYKPVGFHIGPLLSDKEGEKNYILEDQNGHTYRISVFHFGEMLKTGWILVQK